MYESCKRPREEVPLLAPPPKKKTVLCSQVWNAHRVGFYGLFYVLFKLMGYCLKTHVIKFRKEKTLKVTNNKICLLVINPKCMSLQKELSQT